MMRIMDREQKALQGVIEAKFFDYRATYPTLEVLKGHHDLLVQELDMLCQSNWQDWPEKNLYPATDHKWHVFPLIVFGKKIERHCKLCPETLRILERIPGKRTVLYSRLGPQTKLEPHCGWGPLANHVLRCHYGLKVPNDCGIWVEGEYAIQEPGEILVFDDSKWHIGFNFSDQERVVLLIDIERPSWAAPGSSKQEVTSELSELLQYFSVDID